MSDTINKIKNQLALALVPGLVKKTYFKPIEALNWKNIKGQNFENELLLIPYLLNRQGKFIDIGSNMGLYLYVAENCVPSENIHGFEPNPSLYSRLEKLFPKVNLHLMALSHESGETTFKIPVFKDKEVHTRGTLKLDHNEIGETSSQLIKVKLETLDAMVEKLKITDISLIKLDVEGAEFDTLQGATQTIKKQKPVIIAEIEQRHHQTDIKGYLLEFEKEQDYTCHYFDTNERQLKTDWKDKSIEDMQSLSNHGLNRLYINNFIMIPNSGANHLDVVAINTRIAESF